MTTNETSPSTRSPAFEAVITDGRRVVHTERVRHWRYDGRTIHLELDNETRTSFSYTVEKNSPVSASPLSFECRLGAGMHPYEDMQLVVSKAAQPEVSDR